MPRPEVPQLSWALPCTRNDAILGAQLSQSPIRWDATLRPEVGGKVLEGFDRNAVRAVLQKVSVHGFKKQRTVSCAECRVSLHFERWVTWEASGNMFGFGKKDGDGKQVRLEHRGRHARASRTDGVSVRAEKKAGPVNLTVNSSRGFRASGRIADGARAAFQNGRFQLVGRWRAGPLGFNLSKTGMTASVKNKAGAFNFLKPRHSSFKLAGVQVRGKKAAQLQLVYLALAAAALTLLVGLRLLIFAFWLAFLLAMFVRDFAVGFLGGSRKA